MMDDKKKKDMDEMEEMEEGEMEKGGEATGEDKDKRKEERDDWNMDDE